MNRFMKRPRHFAGAKYLISIVVFGIVLFLFLTDFLPLPGQLPGKSSKVWSGQSAEVPSSVMPWKDFIRKASPIWKSTMV